MDIQIPKLLVRAFKSVSNRPVYAEDYSRLYAHLPGTEDRRVAAIQQDDGKWVIFVEKKIESYGVCATPVASMAVGYKYQTDGKSLCCVPVSTQDMLEILSLIGDERETLPSAAPV